MKSGPELYRAEIYRKDLKDINRAIKSHTEVAEYHGERGSYGIRIIYQPFKGDFGRPQQ